MNDYNRIQSAVNAALIVGTNSSSGGTNIYIKPGVYIENVSITDGINLMGMPTVMGGAAEFNIAATPSVFIQGTLTVDFTSATGLSVSNAFASINNIGFGPTGVTNTVTIFGSSGRSGNDLLSMTSSKILRNTNTSTYAFELHDASVDLSSCEVTNDGIFLATGTTSCNVYAAQSLLTGGSRSSRFTQAINCTVTMTDTKVNDVFDMTMVNKLTWKTHSCTFAQNGGTALILAPTGSASTIDFRQCQMDVTTPVYYTPNTTGINTITRLFDCNMPTTSAFSNTQTGGFMAFVSQAQSDDLATTNSSYLSGAEISNLRQPPTGGAFFHGFQQIKRQTAVSQTTTGTVNVDTFSVATGTAILIKSLIHGSLKDHTDVTGGELTALVDGTYGVVGVSPTVFASSTYSTFSISYTNNTVNITVTPAFNLTNISTNNPYNWVATTTRQTLIDSS
jgi:hypothetical protein